MATILVGTWAVRYPLGGVLSWTLQWIIGFARVGHRVFLLEKSEYPGSCFDPVRRVMSDDCSYGVRAVNDLLAQYGLSSHWCYADAKSQYHGLSEQEVESVFRSADVFVDIGSHGAWLPEARAAGLPAVLVDGEPGYTQMKMEKLQETGKQLPEYDHYYTVGLNVGLPGCTVPTAGKEWHTILEPAVVDLFSCGPAPSGAPFTTLMNWQSHAVFEYEGKSYGQKDVEFEKFLTLPSLTAVPLEVSLEGPRQAHDRLMEHGWRVTQAHETSASFDSFQQYVQQSRGEFSVCKNVFVETKGGCFSDRSVAYLASGRPVVLQDTGFSEHLPCGRGLFAVHTMDEAAAAIEQIVRDYERHSKWARELASEHFGASRVLQNFLDGLGL